VAIVVNHRILIDRLAFGGSGVGRIDGMVCFVPYSCPGDELLVKITTRKRSFMIASIVEIVSPSPDRETAPCPLFGSCGGCHWQHVTYRRQLAEKRLIFADTLWRGARVPSDLISDVLPSHSSYGYRNRIQLKLQVRAAKLLIGFYRQGTHLVEDAPGGCPIALPKINAAFETFREILKQYPDPEMISRLTIDAAGQGVVAVFTIRDRIRAASVNFFKEHERALSPLTGLYVQSDRSPVLTKIWGDDRLSYQLANESSGIAPCDLSYLPGAFSQVNSDQNAALLALVQQFAACTGKEQVLDLYCGNGNFSLPLARAAAFVTGVEEYTDSVKAALDNAKNNEIHNVEFLCEDAAAAVKRFSIARRRFDLVVLDPPRSGAVEIVQQISLLRPEKIIYISCDPSTLARDCGVLQENGYVVTASVPVDMFPQTFHLESVTLLNRVEKEL